jgi:hypothetical protein
VSYDHNFLRFLPIFCDFCQFPAIFGEKIGVFLKTQCCDPFFAKSSSSLRINAECF